MLRAFCNDPLALCDVTLPLIIHDNDAYLIDVLICVIYGVVSFL